MDKYPERLELPEKLVLSPQIEDLATRSPSWPRNPRINLTNSLTQACPEHYYRRIIKAFQNPMWAEWFGKLTILSEVEGQARERLKQIQMLTKAAAV